jgi:hypothetical protein
MADVFISYSTKDQELADFVYRHLLAEGISVFMAAASLQPGQEWTETIKANLRASKTVVILASREAMRSPFVMFETGGALFLEGKRIVPIVWDIAIAELPSWLSRYQALDLRKLPHWEAVAAELKQIADQINREKLIGLGIVGAIFLLLSRLPA